MLFRSVFGAKYERNYFKASQSIIPCKIMYSSDSVHFLMQGIRNQGNYPYQEMSLIFTFPSERITDYNGLIIFNKKIIDLSTDCAVKMVTESSEKTLNVTKGELNFKRVQLLSVDGVVNRIVLSGIFELDILGTGLFPESFSDGRFDFGITEREFYSN